MFLVDAEAELRIKIVLQNEFLVKLAGEAHEQVFFCDECRNSSLRRIREYSYTRQSTNCIICLHRLVERENTRLGRLFKCILLQIVHGMAYKITCL